jgi:serine/threonine-protein kinase
VNADPRPPGLGPDASRRAEIFTAALDVPPGATAAFVREACVGDAALEAEVLALLALDAARGGPLDVPLARLAGPLFEDVDGAARTADATPDEGSGRAGQRIGPYRIVREIGRGGMGMVFMAERADGAYEQRVALKVVKAGLLTEELERRFLRERQILARLDHPGIARLLHGGLGPDGRAYLAMQLVEGEPITTWARERGIGTDARLGLFLEACEAVQYAHRQLVVHRDLKPSNMVVTAEGGVTLLDFGIARVLTAGEDGEATTRAGLLLLTPEYAAPEQLRGEAPTVATDVYGLGAVLYELLTESRPFDGGPDSVAERLAGGDPPLPSRAPGLVPALRRRLRGDLDAIVHRALRSDADGRYASVEALAADVRAHLEHRPVRARPDTRRYRFARFARRHAWAMGASAAVAASLLAGIVGTSSMAAAARREEARSEAVRSFLFSLWEGADPAIGGGPPTVRELLDRGADRIDSLAASAGPEVRLDMLTTLGFLYGKLGEYERSAGIFEEAVTVADASFGVDERTGHALDGWAQSLIEAGEAERAESAVRRSIEVRRAAGAPLAALSSSYTTLGALLSATGRYEEAHQAHVTAMDLDRRADAGPLAEATDLNNLGTVSRRLGRYEEAERHLRRAIAIRRAELGTRHPAVASALGNLAAVLRDVGALDEAESLQREALEIRRAVLGADHPDVAISLEQIGLVLSTAGRHAAADSLASEALALRRRVLGERHPATVASLNNLATVRFRRGEYAWAAEAQERVVETWTAELGADDARRVTAVHNLGVMRLMADDLPAAERHLTEAFAARRRTLPVGHPALGISLRWLSELRRHQGRLDEAVSLGRQALATVESAVPAGHARIAEARVALAAALVEAGRADEAVALLRTALAEREALDPAAGLEVAEARVWLGVALARTGARAEARALLLTGLDGYRLADRSGERAAVRARRELASLG